jgi:chorismate mutase
MKHRKKIDSHRESIDSIDRQLVQLLNERAKHAVEIGKMKKELGVPVYDPDRETEIFRNLEKANTGPLTANAVQRLFERIIDESRRIERDSAHLTDDGKK